MKNTTLTQLDNSQISKRIFDEENDAQRVVIVSGQVPDVKVDIDASDITNAILKGLEGFKPNSEEINRQAGVKSTIERIEVPVIIKEMTIERVEVPVIVKEIEYREIKIPVEVVKIVEIEKPTIIKQQEIHILKEDTKETKYLRVAVGCLIVLEILTLLLSRH